MRQTPVVVQPEAIKNCCAALYAGDWVRLLLGDSLHPGGLALTERLATLIGLQPGHRLLDVASGRGASAIHLARKLGCDVVGVELSAESVAFAERAVSESELAGHVRFLAGDAERLPVEDHSVDAVMVECAFCTFPDKHMAAAEFARVLRPGGHLGFSDLVRNGPLSAELDGLAAWVACIADARPLDEYVALLEGAGLRVNQVEHHDAALLELVELVRTRLLIGKVAAKVSAISLSGIDWVHVRQVLQRAATAVADGSLGYVLISASAPETS